MCIYNLYPFPFLLKCQPFLLWKISPKTCSGCHPLSFCPGCHPATTETLTMLNSDICVGISTGQIFVLNLRPQLHWPNRPGLPPGNTLLCFYVPRLMLLPSLLTQLSLLVPHPIQSVDAEAPYRLVLSLSFLLLHTQWYCYPLLWFHILSICLPKFISIAETFFLNSILTYSAALHRYSSISHCHLEHKKKKTSSDSYLFYFSHSGKRYHQHTVVQGRT